MTDTDSTQILSPEAAEEVHKRLDAAVSSYQATAETKFCLVWPSAKAILSALNGLIDVIADSRHRTNGAVALRALEVLADDVYNQRCKSVFGGPPP